jgi:hypothetical protein
MVILHQDSTQTVIANNGFVWIEFADRTEYVCSDDEADAWWTEHDLRTAQECAQASVILDVVLRQNR